MEKYNWKQRFFTIYAGQAVKVNQKVYHLTTN